MTLTSKIANPYNIPTYDDAFPNIVIKSSTVQDIVQIDIR